MSEVIKIKKGFNINLIGEAEKTVSEIQSKHCAIKPTDFHGVFPKMAVKEGDEVKAGTVLFWDKYRDKILFTSPISGKVLEVRRGAKRVLMEVVIENDNKDEYVDFGNADPNGLNREQVIEKLLKSGIWPVIRQRPYSIIADPVDDPKAIFISAFDTSPLAPDYDLIVHGHGEEFQAGLDALAKLTSGKIHLNINGAEGTSKVFTNSKNVIITQFHGKHPAGNVGTQIAHLSPVNKGDIVWHLRPQDVLFIGKLFLQGRVDATRMIALTGSEVKKPHYYRTKLGSSIDEMVKDNLTGGNLRYISGNPLTGTQIEKQGYIGFYDSQVTVLPEGDYYDFFGWASLGISKHSFTRTFFSSMLPKRNWRLNTNLHGGERAFVMTGEFEKVFGWDIYPLQLLKSILIEDIDMMEQLGIYEVDEEDFALCEYIDTSKTNIQEIVRSGLDLMHKEMS
jgi:Na+-transporting NADH:ubiquinone oxidoreductase subunit A